MIEIYQKPELFECRICKIEKSFKNMVKNKSLIHGVETRCNSCKNKTRNKDYLKKYLKNYRAKNKKPGKIKVGKTKYKNSNHPLLKDFIDDNYNSVTEFAKLYDIPKHSIFTAIRNNHKILCRANKKITIYSQLWKRRIYKHPDYEHTEIMAYMLPKTHIVHDWMNDRNG